eukprot:7562477-Pyramimonas_sp.AAC.4
MDAVIIVDHVDEQGAYSGSIPGRRPIPMRVWVDIRCAGSPCLPADGCDRVVRVGREFEAQMW